MFFKFVVVSYLASLLKSAKKATRLTNNMHLVFLEYRSTTALNKYCVTIIKTSFCLPVSNNLSKLELAFPLSNE